MAARKFTAEEIIQMKAAWDGYLTERGEPPVFPAVRKGVAAAVHNRRAKAEKAAEKKGTGRRIKIRRERV